MIVLFGHKTVNVTSGPWLNIVLFPVSIVVSVLVKRAGFERIFANGTGRSVRTLATEQLKRYVITGYEAGYGECWSSSNLHTQSSSLAECAQVSGIFLA